MPDEFGTIKNETEYTSHNSSADYEIEKSILSLFKEKKKLKKKKKKLHKEYKTNFHYLKHEAYASKKELRSCTKEYERTKRAYDKQITKLEIKIQTLQSRLDIEQIKRDNLITTAKLVNHITKIETELELTHDFDSIVLREIMPGLFRKYGNKKLFRQPKSFKLQEIGSLLSAEESANEDIIEEDY